MYFCNRSGMNEDVENRITEKGISMKKLFTLFAGLLSLTFAHAQLDTTGIYSWPPLYNSMSTWDEGSFNMNQLGHPDYGWGIYNSQNHNIDGDSLFIIKTLDGKYRDLYIEMKYSAADYYIFRYTDVNGENEIFEKAPCYEYTDKLFLYYSFSSHSFVDREPAEANWDFVLTKYHDTTIDYTVTGLLLNETASACIYDAVDSSAAYNAALQDTTAFSDSLTIIGNSWYELQDMSIVPLKNKAYFVKDGSGEIFRLNVTYFESGLSGLGRVGIRYQKLYPQEGQAVNDTLTMGEEYANDVYYQLISGTAIQASRADWDVAFKTDAFSACIRTNTTMGVELYAYPKGDETAWASYGIGKKPSDALSLTVYPNPVSDLVYLRSDRFRSGEDLDISVTDITGREVLRSIVPVSGDISMDLSSLKPGSYFITVRSSGLVGTARIMKAK